MAREDHPIRRFIVRAFLFLFLVGIGAFGYALLSEEGSTLFAKNAVAVVSISGVIEDADLTVRLLDRLGKSEGVRAVVVRIDSPGGGVAPSQELYDAVVRLRAKKPVVASLGNLAASGGYYVASACDRVVANPGTLTGSIGVIMQMGNYIELLKKIGITGFVLKAGRYKDLGSPLRDMTDDEKKLIEDLLANVHGQFIAAVATGRGLTVEQVRPLADGRIFSGEQALSLKLVDQLGGLRDAMMVAAERAGISGEPERIDFEEWQSPWWWRRLRGLVEETPGFAGGLRFLYLGNGPL